MIGKCTSLQIIFFSEQGRFVSPGAILSLHKVCLVRQFYFYVHNCYVYCSLIHHKKTAALDVVSNVLAPRDMLQFSPTYVPLK